MNTAQEINQHQQLVNMGMCTQRANGQLKGGLSSDVLNVPVCLKM